MQYKKVIISIYPVLSSNNKKFQVFTYFGEPSLDIANQLKRLDLNICFRTNNSLGKLIRNNKSKTPDDKKSGVYKLECGTCDKLYIGQTGRTFIERIREHFRSYFNHQDYASNYANHLIDFNHRFNNKYSILH